MAEADPLPVTPEDVRRAAALIAGSVERTPQALSRTLSDMHGCEIVLKFENLQYTASFKERGALVKLLSLDDAQRRKGVVAMSAGNHAQGVAYHARRLGIPATIVMPRATPFSKVGQTRHFGARVVLHGDDLSEAAAHAARLQAEEGLAFVPPYDDPAVIAGQGTIALEMLEDDPALDLLLVPVGGGGLVAGIAVAAKAVRPGIEVIGVEAALYPALSQVLRGEPACAGGSTIADGIAVKEPGLLTRRIAAALVSDIMLVDEAAIEEAVLSLIEIEKTVVEGAGAVGLAAVAANPERFAGRRVGIVLSGGNIDARLLSAILMRGLVRSGRLVQVRVTLADTPGLLARVARTIGEAGGNIVEVYHQRLFHDVPLRTAELDITLEARDAEHVRAILSALAAEDLPTQLLSSVDRQAGGRVTASSLPRNRDDTE